MSRFIAIVEVDTASPDDWKAEVMNHLQEAMRLFLEHGTRALPKAGPKAGKVANG